MEETKAHRACTFCKSQKIKCSRSLPVCCHCQRAGRTCVYPGQQSLKIRNQTDKTASRAVKLWRSRASKPCSNHTDVPRPQLDVSLPVEGLARRRFVYDFSIGSLSPMFQDILAECKTFPDCSDAQGPLDLAFDAVALANFSRRYNDHRAVESAARMHSLAVSKLRESLCVLNGSTSEITAAAILLGLYQSFCQDPRFAGSWVHHFRGALNLLLLLDPGTPYQLRVLRFLAKQAAHVSSRLCIPVRLPNELRKWLQSEVSIDSRAARLLYWTAGIRACDKNKAFRLQRENQENLAEALKIEQELQVLESDLRREIPHQSRPNDPTNHAPWWRSFSSHPGSPPVEHIYPSTQAASIWNTCRMARLTLVAWALQFEAELLFDMTQSILLDHGVQLIDDICGSLYSVMTLNSDGRPAVDSLDAVPGSSGYGSHMLLANIHDMLLNREQHCELLLERAGHDKLAWIGKVTMMFSGALGITEALLWEEGNDVEKQVVLAKLAFEG